MKHFKIGGSTASRTIACPGWLELSKRVPKRPAGPAADEGNLLHDAMEAWYLEQTAFERMVGALTFNQQTLTEDHLPLLYSARTQMDNLLDLYGGEEYECEPFVQYEVGRIGGSIDMITSVNARGWMLLADYKFGREAVSAQGNAQLLFYAMCARKDPKTADLFTGAKGIALAIIQPRCSDAPDVWEVPL